MQRNYSNSDRYQREQGLKSSEKGNQQSPLILNLDVSSRNNGLPWLLSGKETSCQCRRQRHGYNPWVRKIPWRREWLPTPVFLPGKSHGQRNLMGNSPCARKELDTTDQPGMHKKPKHSFFLFFIVLAFLDFPDDSDDKESA